MEEELGHQVLAREKYVMGCKANKGKGPVHLWQVRARVSVQNPTFCAVQPAVCVACAAVARCIKLLYVAHVDAAVESMARFTWFCCCFQARARLEEKAGDMNAAVHTYNRATTLHPTDAGTTCGERWCDAC
jgi:hypothetical protein